MQREEWDQRYKQHIIKQTKLSDSDAQQCVDAVEEMTRAFLMPKEQDAINLLWEAWQRLRELGWREARYCPKDGQSFQVIEPGSTGIFEAHYEGKWPDGHYMARDGGDSCPSDPILYKPNAKKARGRR